MADHGANGPEVVVAVGGSTTEEMGPSAVRSRCWSEVFAARCSTQTPWDVPPVTGDTATNKRGPSRRHRTGRDTTSKQGRKGDSPSSGAADEHHAARRTP